MLEEELKLTIYNKHRGMLTNGVVMHYDNALLHMAAVIIETIQELKFELLPHSAQSPDLAPSDYHIFRLLGDVYMDTTNAWRN
jgi:hypothetical protein